MDDAFGEAVPMPALPLAGKVFWAKADSVPVKRAKITHKVAGIRDRRLFMLVAFNWFNDGIKCIFKHSCLSNLSIERPNRLSER
jgi:hypothetical protein